MAAAVPGFTADDSCDFQNRDFVFRLVVLEGHFFKVLPRLPPGLRPEGDDMNEMAQIAQHAQDEEDAEDDRELLPGGPSARPPWRRRGGNQRGWACRNERRRWRLAWPGQHIVFHSGGKLSHAAGASKCDSACSIPHSAFQKVSEQGRGRPRPVLERTLRRAARRIHWSGRSKKLS